jgi:hypothetical protein
LYYQEQNFVFNTQFAILGAIGSIYVSVFGILQMVNNYLTKNSEDVVMANKLYKVKKNAEFTAEGEGLDQVLNTLKNKQNFEFSPMY